MEQVMVEHKDIETLFKVLDIEAVNPGAFNGRWLETGGSTLESYSPIDGRLLGKVVQAQESDYGTNPDNPRA